MAAGEKKEKDVKKETQSAEFAESVDQDAAAPQPRYKKEEEKTLFTWKAPARPFTPRDKKFWSTAISLAVIFGMILYIIEGMMPVMVIISFIFLYYILTTVKPEDIEYKITNYGIRFADSLIEWPEMFRYWFSQRGGSNLMVVDTNNLLGRLEILIDEKDKDKIGNILEDYLPQEEASPSGIERAADWFSKKMPDNKPSPHSNK